MGDDGGGGGKIDGKAAPIVGPGPPHHRHHRGAGTRTRRDPHRRPSPGTGVYSGATIARGGGGARAALASIVVALLLLLPLPLMTATMMMMVASASASANNAARCKVRVCAVSRARWRGGGGGSKVASSASSANDRRRHSKKFPAFVVVRGIPAVPTPGPRRAMCDAMPSVSPARGPAPKPPLPLPPPPSLPHRYPRPPPPLFASSDSTPDVGADEAGELSALRRIEGEIYELNGGVEFNLRSPRQISRVLFPDGAGVSNRSTGTSTSREALRSFMEGDGDGGVPGGVVVNGHHSSPSSILQRRKAIAAKVLEWRSIRSSMSRGERRGRIIDDNGAAGRGRRQRRRQRHGRRGASPSGSTSVDPSSGAAATGGTNATALSGRRQRRAAFSSDASAGTGGDDGDIGDEGRSAVSPGGGGGDGRDDRYTRHVRSLFVHTSSDDDDDDENRVQMDEYWRDVLLHRIDRPSARDLVYQLDPRLCPMGYDPNAAPSGDGYVISSSSAGSNNNRAPSRQGKRGTLLGYVRFQKSSRFPTSVLLVRVGEFYESYGLDAVLLVQFCGLNPMGGKARAGCPYRNVQATLNGLTDAGFNVAVYEEADGGVGSARGGRGGNKLKERMLAQLVTPASPTYLYDLVLGGGGGGAVDAASDALSSSSSLGDRNSAPPPRPHVGIVHSSRSGYTVVEISLEERSVRVSSERVTAEAVSCRLSAYPPADPIFYVPTPNEYGGGGPGGGLDVRNLPFFPARRRRGGAGGVGGGSSSSCSSVPRTKIIPPHLVEVPQAGGGKSDVERAKDAIVSALLRTLDVGAAAAAPGDERGDASGGGGGAVLTDDLSCGKRTVSADDFVLVASSSSATTTDGGIDGGPWCAPLHKETASQLGLLTTNNEGDPTVPCLVSSLLPSADAPSASRHFLRRWLLVPPPPVAAEAMRTLVRSLKGEGKEEDDASRDGGVDKEEGEGGEYYKPRPLPPLHVPPLGKVLSLLRAGQASAGVFRELVRVLDATATVLGDGAGCENGDDDGQHDRLVVRPLVALVEYESGMSAEPTALRGGCIDTMEEIERVVRTAHTSAMIGASSHGRERKRSHHLDEVTDLGDFLPRAFLERNELTWRGRVRSEAAGDAYDQVERAAARLADAVAEDYWGLNLKWNGETGRDYGDTIANERTTCPAIVQDIFNNIVALKEVPPWVTDPDDEKKYYHPRDRNGKILRNRYTTQKVDDALSGYLDACGDARRAVASALTGLSERLCDCGYLPHVVRASHANLILSTASRHAARANAAGWTMAASRGPDTCEPPSAISPGEEGGRSPDDATAAAGPASGRFVDVWPYWMDRTEAVPNTFTLDGMFVLTAPNMSGKSTLMRSTAAAALLTNCGLCAPLVDQGSWVRRFDALFVRGASADVPSEDRSAFGAEMGDVSSMLRCCTERSLVFVDELGRGTSPRDGTTIAGAVVEAMATKGISGFFATHLHGILRLPLRPRATARIAKKRMAVVDVTKSASSVSDDEGETKPEKREDYGWTYRMEDGVCTDSLAMLTAERFGLPREILDRADQFSKLVSDVEIATSSSAIDVASESSLTPREAPGTTSGQEGAYDDDDVPSADGGTARAAAAVIDAVERVSGGEALYIPPGYTTPASFEGCACVYVLISDCGDRSGSHSRRCRYYVGETESLAQRLARHRARGNAWSGMSAIVVKVGAGGRTNARNIESRLIGHMARSGHDMISVADGRKATKPLGWYHLNNGEMDRLGNS